VSDLPTKDALRRQNRSTKQNLPKICQYLLTDPFSVIKEPPDGFRIEPLRSESKPYLYARQFGCRLVRAPDQSFADDLAEIAPGDIYLGVEWGADVVPGMKPWFLAQRARGLQVYFLVHDLLALFRPATGLCPRRVEQFTPRTRMISLNLNGWGVHRSAFCRSAARALMPEL
jgi:hypothetical protein